MTVSSTTNSVTYTGNGVTVDFAVTFKFYEIEVYEILSGVVTAKTAGTHYTVAGGEGETGTVTMLVATASGTSLVIRRATTKTQEADYVENDAFPADVTEQALDRLTMMLQELGQRVDYNPTFSAQTGTPVFSLVAARYSRFNDTVFFRGRAIVGNIADAAGYLKMTLPVALAGTSASVSGTGRNHTTGAPLVWYGIDTTTVAIVAASGSGLPATTGDTLSLSGTYHA